MESLVSALPFVLLFLLCPLAMLFMMRGMHAGHSGHAPTGCDHDADDAHYDRSDRRLRSLEAEVDELRSELARRDAAQGPRAAARGRNADIA